MNITKAESLLRELFPDIRIKSAIGSFNNFTIEYTADGYIYKYSYMNGRTYLTMRAAF